MNGGNIFAFTLKRVPEIFAQILSRSGVAAADVDHFVLHQSNRFIMQHLAKKLSIDMGKVPMILDDFGNTGGPSIPLAMTRGLPPNRSRPSTLLSIGYGVGLSWAASLFALGPDVPLLHRVYQPTAQAS
jgi:3-oxoacyl-[acyl-carrier-protein] synthase-3